MIELMMSRININHNLLKHHQNDNIEEISEKKNNPQNYEFSSGLRKVKRTEFYIIIYYVLFRHRKKGINIVL